MISVKLAAVSLVVLCASCTVASPDPSLGLPSSEEVGSLDADSAERAPSQKVEPEATGDESTEPDGSVQEVELSVLGSYLGFEVPGIDTQPFDPALYLESQDAIAECMAAEGFTYVPWLPDAEVLIPPVDPQVPFGTKGFAEKYGFGVSTQAFAQRDLPTDLIGYTGNRSGINRSADPNAELVAALSEPDQIAYDTAYWGADNPLFTGEGLGGLDPFDFGCVGEGSKLYDAETPPGVDDFLEDFADELQELAERVEAHENYTTFVADIDACVRSKGYEFYNFGEMPFYFDELVATEVDPLATDPAGELTEEQAESLTDDEIDAIYDAPRALTDEALQALSELQQLEVAVATAEWECGGTAEALQQLERTISEDLQLELIERHRERIEAHRR